MDADLMPSGTEAMTRREREEVKRDAAREALRSAIWNAILVLGRAETKETFNEEMKL